MSEFRDAVGFLLRLPVVAALAALWILTGWAMVLEVAVLALLALPVLYPFAYAEEWLRYALLGRKGPVLPDYWNGYPDKYLRLLKTGSQH